MNVASLVTWFMHPVHQGTLIHDFFLTSGKTEAE